MPKKQRNLKLPIFVALAVILLVAGIWFYKAHHPANKTGKTADGQPVNLNPATKEEKQESQDSKDVIVNDKNSSPKTTSNGKKAVTVTITSADANQVSAYVSGVFEEGGTCTATFTQGSTVTTRTSVGFQNASYTQCAPITPNLPSGGTWSVTVAYSSSTAEGTSSAKTF